MNTASGFAHRRASPPPGEARRARGGRASRRKSPTLSWPAWQSRRCCCALMTSGTGCAPPRSRSGTCSRAGAALGVIFPPSVLGAAAPAGAGVVAAARSRWRTLARAAGPLAGLARRPVVARRWSTTGPACVCTTRLATVIVDIRYPGRRVDFLGDLVHVVLRGQPGAHVQELGDPGIGSQVAYCPAQEPAVLHRHQLRLRRRLAHLQGSRPVSGEVRDRRASSHISAPSKGSWCRCQTETWCCRSR
jgi:hypothetical protein